MLFGSPKDPILRLQSRGEIEPVISKVEAILKVKAPQGLKEVQRFLGMVGYYRTFIPHFSDIAAPLTDCLRGGRRRKRWEWTEKCQRAFEQLKETLCSAPVLRAHSKQFRVATDASGRGIGAVLSQENVLESKTYRSRK